jgi:hypothetical protein
LVLHSTENSEEPQFISAQARFFRQKGFFGPPRKTRLEPRTRRLDQPDLGRTRQKRALRAQEREKTAWRKMEGAKNGQIALAPRQSRRGSLAEKSGA